MFISDFMFTFHYRIKSNISKELRKFSKPDTLLLLTRNCTGMTDILPGPQKLSVVSYLNFFNLGKVYECKRIDYK